VTIANTLGLQFTEQEFRCGRLRHVLRNQLDCGRDQRPFK
jgi:hypothetical protein